MFTIEKIATPDKISNEDIKTLNNLEIRTLGEDCLCQKTGAYWWLVYDEDGEIAGFAGMMYYPELDSAFLYRSGILKKYRGNGLQKRLITVRERQAKKDGYSRIVTYTSYDNYPSANSLISKGYKLYKPPFMWGVENALYFQKTLDK